MIVFVGAAAASGRKLQNWGHSWGHSYTCQDGVLVGKCSLWQTHHKPMHLYYWQLGPAPFDCNICTEQTCCWIAISLRGNTSAVPIFTILADHNIMAFNQPKIYWKFPSCSQGIGSLILQA